MHIVLSECASTILAFPFCASTIITSRSASSSSAQLISNISILRRDTILDVTVFSILPLYTISALIPSASRSFFMPYALAIASGSGKLCICTYTLLPFIYDNISSNFVIQLPH